MLNTYFKGQTTGSGGGGVRAAPARELVRAGSGGHRRRSVHQTCRGLGATGKDDKTAAATTGQRQARNRRNRSVGSPEPFFQREHGATVMLDGLLATQINKIDATLRNGFPSSLNYQNQLFGTGKLVLVRVEKVAKTHALTRKERKGRDSYAAVAAMGQHFRASVAAATPHAALACLRPSTALQAWHSTCFCPLCYFLLFLLVSKKQSATKSKITNWKY